MMRLFGCDGLFLFLLFFDELLEEFAVFELSDAGDVTWASLAVCSSGALKLLFLNTMVRL